VETRPAPFETLEVSCSGSRGRLELARPERLNALGATALRELAEAARFFDEQTDAKVVVVAGAGRAFSAGADLRDPPLADAAPSSGSSWRERRAVGSLGAAAMEAIENMRAVTVARVQGYAIGGGVVLLCACDLRVAARDAVLRIPEVELGLPLTWGAIPRLVREVGPSTTKDWVMTCRDIPAEEAQRAGLLNRVVDADRLDAEVEALVARLEAMPEVPVAMTKEHVNGVARQASAAVLGFAEGDRLVAAALDPEAREAAVAYAARHLGKSAGKP
jgi:enoyl-CoA hydratase/carnithine racemase